jgi:cephalosporin-C deacetylase
LLLRFTCAAVASLIPPLSVVSAGSENVANSRSSERSYHLEVKPDRDDWNYRVGEKVIFHVSITSSQPLTESVTVRYRIGPETFEPEVPRKLNVPPGGAEVDGGTMDEPGFLRMKVSAQISDQRLNGLATVAFSPEKITPTQIEPDDFEAFWSNSKAELSKIPIDAQLRARTDLSGPNFDAFELSLANFDPEGKKPRFFGILCVPKSEGKYPAILQTPGAGVRGYSGEIWIPRDRFITLEVGIHGIPVTNEPDFYKQQAEGSLQGYERRNLENRDRFYYRRVYLGCLRALEYLQSHPKWDGKNLMTRGGSQGGQLALVAAVLEPRVTAVAAAFPAFCDVTGYLQGRAGGWPGLFNGKPPEDETGLAVWNTGIKTTGYYDTVNFAKRIRVPVHFSMGYNDEVCPPTAFFAMYNQVSAPKELKIYPPSGHDLPPDGWGHYTHWTVDHAQAKK